MKPEGDPEAQPFRSARPVGWRAWVPRSVRRAARRVLNKFPRNDAASQEPNDADWVGVAPIWPEQQHLIPPLDLWVNPTIPWVEFFRWPYEYRAYLTLLCGLQTNHVVLELGCGHGRTMHGLADYIQPPGAYEGLDISSEHIEFAQAHYQRSVPNLRFTCADVRHPHYNPHGLVEPQDYVFPYPSDHFDVVYAASLFTHLLPDAAVNYLKQSLRVLRPSGSCMFSFLILDHYLEARSLETEPLWSFDHSVPGIEGVAVINPDQPEDLVAYDLATIHMLAEVAGLRVDRVLPGWWSRAKQLAFHEQDLVLLAPA